VFVCACLVGCGVWRVVCGVRRVGGSCVCAARGTSMGQAARGSAAPGARRAHAAAALSRGARTHPAAAAHLYSGSEMTPAARSTSRGYAGMLVCSASVPFSFCSVHGCASRGSSSSLRPMARPASSSTAITAWRAVPRAMLRPHRLRGAGARGGAARGDCGFWACGGLCGASACVRLIQPTLSLQASKFDWRLGRRQLPCHAHKHARLRLTRCSTVPPVLVL
jgi:hypothetical protein